MGAGGGGGLLDPAGFGDLSGLAPPPAWHQPQMSMTAGQLVLGRGGASLTPDVLGESPELADALQAYAAGLQPYIAPAGTPWQQEVVFDRIARTDAELQTQMLNYFSNARSYDSALSESRIRASDYYNGRPLGDEEPGRSHLVMTTTRDTIRATLPSMLRVFTAVENPVEFTPSMTDDQQLGVLHASFARQATVYARWALFTANRGWIVLHDAILDALTRRVGWVRWYWGQQRAQRTEDCDRLLAPQLQILLREPGITAQRITRRPMLPNEIRAVSGTPEGMAYFQAGGPAIFYAARITRAAARAWPIVEAVGSECVWIVPDADQVSNARAIFHVRDLPASDLIAAGLPRDKVLAAASDNIAPGRTREATARDRASGSTLRASDGSDPSMKMVRYTEGWCRMDTDGDDIAELIHTHAVGLEPQLIRWDRTDDIPLAAFTPYREPGRVIGLSQEDMTRDLQRTQTRVMRGVLDSLGQSLYPRTVITVGQVNLEDARQTAIGSIIRVTQQGAVAELTKPFVGAQALPVLEVLEAVRESRTGITRTSQGMTAESLQSTTPTAVSAQTTAAGDRLDMIARTLAETGLVPLYQGLLRMMAAHQDRPNMLSINGRWVQCDPRALSIMWATQCNVGGTGSQAEKLAMLAAIAGKQETILAPAVAKGMLDTPLVGLPEYRNTLARMCEVAGIADVVNYFKELPPGWQPPPPPNAPTTDQLLAQVEQQKTQMDAIDDARKSAHDQMKMLLDDDRGRSEAALSAWVAAYATAARHGTPLPSIGEFKSALKLSPLALGGLASGGAPPGSGGIGGTPPAPGGGMSPPGAPGGQVMSPVPPPVMPTTPPGSITRVPSAPIALPPNAAPAGTTSAIDPASVLAMRRAMIGGQGAGSIASALLANRAGLAGTAGATPNVGR